MSNQQQSFTGSDVPTCSRFADTPETNAHLGRHANSPDDTAMWLEIGLPRQFERERNTARVVAADAIRELERIIDTGDTYASREIVQNLKDFLRGDSSENAKCAGTDASEKTL